MSLIWLWGDVIRVWSAWDRDAAITQVSRGQDIPLGNIKVTVLPW